MVLQSLNLQTLHPVDSTLVTHLRVSLEINTLVVGVAVQETYFRSSDQNPTKQTKNLKNKKYWVNSKLENQSLQNHELGFLH